MPKPSLDSFGTRSVFAVGDRHFNYFDITALERKKIGRVERLPFSLRILLESLLRHEDGVAVRAEDILALCQWEPRRPASREIAFTPARVIMQDFTAVPAIVDLAAMRDAVARQGGDPARINPLVPVELVIDHSVQVDAYGSADAAQINVEKEFQRNQERYTLLRWGQSAFDNFRVVPPATGIVHQVNLEHLARVVSEVQDDAACWACFDTVVGTDSHTTMINGLGVLGWGVGGIEAEAAMLGQPVSMLIPQVVGFSLYGSLPEGATATDLVLTITQMLRRHDVVGKFVEFYGSGVSSLALADRATISNMAPEYGATCAMFPIDCEALDYLRLTGRSPERVALVEAYVRAQGVFFDRGRPEADYSDTLSLDLGSVEPCLAGPKRPQDRVSLHQVRQSFLDALQSTGVSDQPAEAARVRLSGREPGGGEAELEFDLSHGSVVIAAITSCANTSNPSLLVAAGLLARNAVERGLQSRPWVKTSLAPGSKVVTQYLKAAGLTPYLDQLGFHLVGYGCTTCIGNSGPLLPEISQAIAGHGLVVCSVLSGNRNFEGRINPDVRANYLASPPLVVAYALAGRIDIDLYTEPLGYDQHRRAVYLRDIWPSALETRSLVAEVVRGEMFAENYADVFAGDERWRTLPIPGGDRYAWDPVSTYAKEPPFFKDMPVEPLPIKDLRGLRVLAVLGDTVTTDHISPAGSIPPNSPAGRYLIENGVIPQAFNSYGARRGNHEVMMRGTFGNIRIRNLLVPGTEGGYTRYPGLPNPIPIYDAAMKYQEEGVPLLIIAGREYGAGSSRDWAAKGTRLLGVKAVLVESFERIHRSNLVGMGVLPLQFEDGQSREARGLTGFERYDVLGLEDGLEPLKKVTMCATDEQGFQRTFRVTVRIDTPNEIAYYRHGGILQYVLRLLARKGSAD